jgi:nicotinamidase-related amidase
MMRAMRGLLIIDIQNDYFPGGANPLVGPEAAAEAARRALDAFRERGERIVHLQHVWDAPDAAFMRPGTDGVEIVDATVRAGADLGFGMTVIHDGCAAPDLEFGGRQIDGASVHAAFMAALGDGYATLVGSGELAG